MRILQIANARMGTGGTETFLMNLYRNIDRTKVQFDFIVFSDEEGVYEKEIKSLGGNIYKVPRKRDGILKNLNGIRNVVAEGNYKIVHRHTGSAIAVFDLLACKLGGAKHLIMHSQNTGDMKDKLHFVCRPFLKMLAEKCYACSKTAGEWMYGKRKYELVRSVIDETKYSYDPEKRNIMRKKMGWENKFVIGNIAVFRPEKNHLFIVEVFEKICQQCENVVLVLVGNGELLETVRDKVRNLGLSGKVVFAGQQTEISEYYNAMDVFFMPSLFEGFPLSLIEAQSCGLPCILSKGISEEVDIIPEIVTHISVTESIDPAVEEILRLYNSRDRRCSRQDYSKAIIEAGYGAKKTAKMFEDVYLELEKSI